VSLRCWLFGHEWLHLDSHFVADETLASEHLCDRCDAKRSVQLGIERAREVEADAE